MTGPAKFENSPIWVCVQSLPSVLTQDKYRLKLNHKLAKALRELIETRNRLVHVNEPAIHLISPSANMEVVGDQLRVTFTQQLSEWLTMKLEKAKTFHEAVDVYFSEVVFPEQGRIKEGQIVLLAR